MACNKNKLYETSNYLFRDILNFDFLEKGLGIVPLPYFENDFSRKMVLMLYSSNWPNFIIWFPLLLEYWPSCVLQLFVNQVVTSYILRLKLVSAIIKFLFFFTKWSPFKSYEKCFSFHLKSSIRSRDIQFFVIFSLSTFSR